MPKPSRSDSAFRIANAGHRPGKQRTEIDRPGQFPGPFPGSPAHFLPGGISSRHTSRSLPRK
jgi:hypothetical protein